MGTVGLIIADPCIVQDPYCIYAEQYKMRDTLQRAINALAKHNELDYWMNVGDLFYEVSGERSKRFFDGLTPKALGTVHGAVVGNHDLWIGGEPEYAETFDSFGNFHMQWYPQDTMSAKKDHTDPFDFHRDPEKNETAAASNFQWYNRVGNVAFIGYTAVYGWETQRPFFEEACAWAADEDPALLLVLGHYHAVDMGAKKRMDAPSVYNMLRGMPGCNKLGTRIKFFEGHLHCNGIIFENTGFLVGSFGMGPGGCKGLYPYTGDGALGLPILDTRGKKSKLYYLELAKDKQKTHFDDLLECLESKGLSGCLGKPGVKVWMEESIPRSHFRNMSVSV